MNIAFDIGKDGTTVEAYVVLEGKALPIASFPYALFARFEPGPDVPNEEWPQRFYGAAWAVFGEFVTKLGAHAVRVVLKLNDEGEAKVLKGLIEAAGNRLPKTNGEGPANGG